MKQALFIFIVLSIANINAQSQSPGILFDSVRIGFNTGDYPLERYPNTVRTADIDNDGDMDAVMSEETFAHGILVMKNDGAGLFSAPVRYATTLAARDIAIADINGDGLKDIAVTNTGNYEEGNSIAVFLNTGGGNFGAPVYYVTGSGTVGIAAGDLDNDGDIDLAVSNKLADSVTVLINPGSGTFNTITRFFAGDSPQRLAIAKVNSDNLPDIVVGNNTQHFNILYNGGSNTFANRVETTVSTVIWAGDGDANVLVADVDNDNDNDIVYTSSQTWDGNRGWLKLYRNNGNGTLASPETIELAYSTVGSIDLAIADLDNNGWKDIVAIYYGRSIGDGYEVLLNNGSGGFLPAVLRPAGQGTHSVAVADVDNDSNIDILTADTYSMQLTVHKNYGNANFPTPALYKSNTASAGSLDVADIDHDGDLDVVSSASSIAAVGVPVTVQLNNGDGTFTAGVPYSVGGGGVQAKFRDLNGDGNVDLLFASAICCGAYDFHTAMGNGDGTFGPRQTVIQNACGWSDIDAVDMDNDGDLDVIVTEWLGCQNVGLSARRIYINLNNGNGTFAPPNIKLVNPHPSCLATGDFNGDGYKDLITGQSQSIDLHIATGTGDIQPPVSFATEESPYALVVNDFNNDGKLDIATCTEYDFEGMSVLLGNGDGTFQPAQNYKGAYSPDIRNEAGITSGDVDGDGDVDIVVANSASNDISVFLNNGNGTFTSYMRYGVSYYAASPVLADFNNDGKKDILTTVTLLFSGSQNAVALLKGTHTALLPITVHSFTGSRNNNNVVLNWVMGTTGKGTFEVQRSFDGRRFNNIGTIAAGNINRYTFADHDAKGSILYYRVRIVNEDGRATFSNVLSFAGSATENKMVAAVNGARINVTFSTAPLGTVHFTLSDMWGRKIYEADKAAEQVMNLEPGRLTTGVYVLTAYADQKIYTVKVVL